MAYEVMTRNGEVRVNSLASAVAACMVTAACGQEEVPRGAVRWLDVTYGTQLQYDGDPAFWCPIMLCNGIWSFRPWFIGGCNFINAGQLPASDVELVRALHNTPAVFEAWLAATLAGPTESAVLNGMLVTLRHFFRATPDEDANVAAVRNVMEGHVMTGNVNRDSRRAKKLQQYALPLGKGGQL